MDTYNSRIDEDYTGFSQGSTDVISALHKALSAGSGVDAAAFTGGRALIPESLDTTLVNVLWNQEEAKLFKALKKQPVKSPVHQWTKRTDVGASDGAWVAEGGDSIEADQTIQRMFAVMKYLQTLRKVTLQMTLTNSIEDSIALEKQAGALWIIKQVERALFNGDSSVVAEEPDGLDKLITTNIIDLRGKTANSSQFETAISEACRRIRGYFGVATDMFMSLMAMDNVQGLLRDRIRFPANSGGDGRTLGNMIFEQYPTPFGKPNLNDDIFITEGGAPVASALTTTRPSQVTISLSRQAASGGRTSHFASGDAGSYYYKVVAVNKYGGALASTAVQVTNVVAGDEVVIAITDGSTAGTGYFVYRSKKDAADGTDCRYAYKIARASASPTIYDTNADLPGCSSSYILNLNSTYDAIEWQQFLPLMKFDLYPTNAPIFPFLMLLFGTLGLKKEEQTVRIKNIAPSTLGWF